MEQYEQDRNGHSPIMVGDVVDVKIVSVGAKGDGVAKIKGFAVFVPNTQLGEEVRVRITRVLSKFGFGERVDVESGEEQAGQAIEEEEAYR